MALKLRAGVFVVEIDHGIALLDEEDDDPASASTPQASVPSEERAK